MHRKLFQPHQKGSNYSPIKAAYKPNKGGTPATNANATASGTNAIATVNPASILILKKEMEYGLSLRLELLKLSF